MKHFFPYPGLSDDVIAAEKKIKRLLPSLAELDRLRLYQAFTQVASGCKPFDIRVSGEFLHIYQGGRSFQFPRELPINLHTNIICGYEKWLSHKYSLPGFVAVDDGDVVYDCGAYVGGFSAGVAHKASAIHIFEPAAMNIKCIKKNLVAFEHVRINEMGLYSYTTSLPLNVSSSSVEHSFLPPDDGEIVGRVNVPVKSIADYTSEHKVKKIDFLKLEAEGCELDILKGLGGVRPKKMAIDVSPEMNGASPVKVITQILSSHGYTTRERGNVLFARI